jgi:hypothetical protein
VTARYRDAHERSGHHKHQPLRSQFAWSKKVSKEREKWLGPEKAPSPRSRRTFSHADCERM